MLEHRDMIVMSGDWNRSPNAIQHITEILAQRNRVVWVSGIPIRSPRVRMRDLRRVVDKGRKMFSTSMKSYNRSIPVTEVHPFFIPYYDQGTIRQLNDRFLRSLLLEATRKLGFKNVIVLATRWLQAS